MFQELYALVHGQIFLTSDLADRETAIASGTMSIFPVIISQRLSAKNFWGPDRFLADASDQEKVEPSPQVIGSIRKLV